MAEDIEHLKVHKIVRREGDRVGLGVLGQPTKSEPPTQMMGGEPGSRRDPEVSDETLSARALDAIRTIYDPEIPVNIVDLGLIYGVTVVDDVVEVTMTLTAPACPVAGEVVRQVAEKSAGVPGAGRSQVHLVWDPPWSQSKMSEEALLELGLL